MNISKHFFKKISRYIIIFTNVIMYGLYFGGKILKSSTAFSILDFISTIFLLIYDKADVIQNYCEEKINNNSTKILLLLSKQNDKINNMSSEIETIKTNSINLSHRTPNEPYVSDSDGEIQIVVK